MLPASQKSNQRELIEKKKALIVKELLNLILREVVSLVVNVIYGVLSWDSLWGLWIVWIMVVRKG